MRRPLRTLPFETEKASRNLKRAELTATQEAEHLARRKEFWEAMRAAEIQVVRLVPPEIGFKQPPPQEEGFAASTAAATGKDKSTINRAIRCATEVCQEARNLIRGAETVPSVSPRHTA